MACRDSTLAALSEGDVLLFGDFNMHIAWSSIKTGVPTDSNVAWFMENFIHGLGILQHNMHNTRGNRILDYVLSTCDKCTISKFTSI